jgi:ribosomal protein L20A (L18A)
LINEADAKILTANEDNEEQVINEVVRDISKNTNIIEALLSQIGSHNRISKARSIEKHLRQLKK